MIGEKRNSDTSMKQNSRLCIHGADASQCRDAMNRHGSARPAAIEPNRMYGRRRPQRERVLSDNQPNKGSVNASNIRAIISTVPTRLGARPRYIVNTGPERLG